jgi:hypothetical protein
VHKRWQDERYKNEPSKEEFPMYESLKLTIDRTLPYWNNVIVPQIKYGRYPLLKYSFLNILFLRQLDYLKNLFNAA